MRLILLSLVFLTLSIVGFAQQPNAGFEYNTLVNWDVYYDNSGTSNPSSVTNTGTTPLTGYNTTNVNLFDPFNGFLLTTVPKNGVARVTSTNQKNDRFGNFPVVCPFNGSGKHSVKLGNDSLSSVCQGISYNIHIPANSDKYKVVFYYAAAIEDPGTGHESWEKPFFAMNAFDSADVTTHITCSEFSADVDLVINNPSYFGSWKKSATNSSSGNPVYYTPWVPSTIFVKNMAGKTLTLQFLSSGCSPAFGGSSGTPGSHWGYAYVDLDTTVLTGLNNADDTLRLCKYDTCLNYTPPPGYKGYQVFDSATGTQLAIDTNHCSNCAVTLKMCGTNLPKVKSKIMVVLTPYAGFGCIDTLYYIIDTAPRRILPPITSIKDSICAGNTMVVSNAASGGVWFNTNSTIATITNLNATSVIFTGLNNGRDSLIYYAKNRYGCSDTSVFKSFYVVGHKLPAISGKSVVCLNDTIHLSDSIAGGTWSLDSSKYATIDAAGVLSSVKYGSVKVKYVYTNYFGCKDSTTKQIQIGYPPLPPVIGNNTICAKTTTTLTNATAGGVWTSASSGVATVNASSGTVTGVTAGTAVIKYTYTPGACSDSAKFTITVNAPVNTPITGDTIICTGKSTVLSNSSAGGSWSSSNTAVASTVGSTVNGVKGGSAVISYMYTSNGCPDTVTYKFKVVDYPKVSAIGGDSVLCLGHNATFTDATINGTWRVVDTAVAKITSAGTVIPAQLGSTSVFYSLSVPPGCADSARFDFRVNDFSMNLVATPSNPIIQTNPVTININASTSNFSVLSWTPSALFNNQIATSQTYNTDTTVTVCAIAKSDAGSCVDTACANIIVTPLKTTIFVANVLKINANSPKNAVIKVYSTPPLRALEFKVFNQWGEIVYSTNDVNGSWNGTSGGSLQPVGVYVYVLKATTLANKTIEQKGSITLVK